DLGGYGIVEGLGAGAMAGVDVVGADDPFVLDGVVVAEGDRDRDAGRRGDALLLEMREVDADGGGGRGRGGAAATAEEQQCGDAGEEEDGEAGHHACSRRRGN